MSDKDLENAFLEAAEIAKKLPKNLQEVGFSRAVEQLLRARPADAGARGSDKRASRGTARLESGDGSKFAEFVDAIDRTAYSDMGETSRLGDRALRVLQLAHRDHQVDGLTAGEIATILSQKFRLPTKANSVLKALERETDTVDVRSGAGASRVFHIMAPGEAYVERLRAGEGGSRHGVARGTRSVKKSPRRKAGEPPPATSETSSKTNASKSTGNKKTAKKAGGRPGPKAAIGQLMQAGFFRSARTISEIQEELQHRRGHSYSIQELAPALVRSVRDQSLTRERNNAGQYEYSEA